MCSMTHAIGDGATIYTIHGMLGETGAPAALDPARGDDLDFYASIQGHADRAIVGTGALGCKVARGFQGLSSHAKAVLECVARSGYGTPNADASPDRPGPTPGATFRFGYYYVDADKVAAAKAQHVPEAGAPYLSTNDVFTSRLFQTTGSDIGAIAHFRRADIPQTGSRRRRGRDLFRQSRCMSQVQRARGRRRARGKARLLSNSALSRRCGDRVAGGRPQGRRRRGAAARRPVRRRAAAARGLHHQLDAAPSTARAPGRVQPASSALLCQSSGDSRADVVRATEPKSVDGRVASTARARQLGGRRFYHGMAILFQAHPGRYAAFFFSFAGGDELKENLFAGEVQLLPLAAPARNV